MSELNEQQTKQAKDIFNQFDTDKSGKISADELKNMLPKLGVDLDDAGIKKMLSSADKDQNGEVDFEEFKKIAGGMFAVDVDEEEDNRKTFDEFDTDKDGHINKVEFAKAMRADDPEIEQEEIDGIFAETDDNGDGLISYDEFCKAVNKGQ
ncbi:hypothetical protein K502DRAFT_322839 [Neoconidiobolus thromboides FSU 785]|nr:hypothetical protein K502DRAFT_322839 [Neoconidiobolus thromboides FSU 785]